MFLLCTYANGPYWRSCLEPLLYPSGCSFYRPFSYRAEYLSNDLAATFKSAKQTEQFLNDDDRRVGIFGMSFNTTEGKEFYERFIPLRLVTLTEVQVADEFHLFFKLGDYVTLDGKKLRSVSLTGFVDFAHPQIQLMQTVPDLSDLKGTLKGLTKPGSCTTESPAGLWERFISDDALSTKAKENFKDATVLRILSVTERGQNTKLLPVLLKKRFDLNDIRENRRESRKVFGYELRAGRLFDFQFAYTRLVPSGQEGDLLNAGYHFDNPEDHFEVSRKTLPITGNYRYEEIWTKPKRGQPAPISLDWHGLRCDPQSAPPAGASKAHEKVIGVRIPVMIQAQFWTAERLAYALSALVFGIAASFLFYKAYQLGSIPPAPNQPPSPLIAISTAAGAFFAGTAGSFLQSLAKAFIEDRK